MYSLEYFNTNVFSHFSLFQGIFYHCIITKDKTKTFSYHLMVFFIRKRLFKMCVNCHPHINFSLIRRIRLVILNNKEQFLNCFWRSLTIIYVCIHVNNNKQWKPVYRSTFCFINWCEPDTYRLSLRITPHEVDHISSYCIWVQHDLFH